MATMQERECSAQSTERLPFSAVRSPGAYVAHDNGDLFRVPDEGLSADHSPLIEIVCTTPRMVTKISDNPWVPISEARRLAADADLYVDF